jgi:hypothetical protein
MALSTTQIFQARVTEVIPGENTAGTVRYSATGTSVVNDAVVRAVSVLPQRPLPPDFEIVPLAIGAQVLIIQQGNVTSMVLVDQERYVFEECEP